MKRSAKVYLFPTKSKERKLQAVLDRFQSTVNQYIEVCWTLGGVLNKETLERVPRGHLLYNQHGSALKQALGIISATKASAKALKTKASCPHFSGPMSLSPRNVTFQNASNAKHFDAWLKISTLSNGNPVQIPTKKHKQLNKWLDRPLAKLASNILIGKDRIGRWYAQLTVELPDLPNKTQGRSLGVDIGMNKVLMTSDRQAIGTEFKKYSERIRRRKVGSKGRRRALTARDRYLAECVNRLPWKELNLLAVEDLKHLKTGKKKNRGKYFRKLLTPWRYAYVLERMERKAEEHRVILRKVSPSHTSQTCPQCTHVSRANRKNETFKCCRCGYAEDADFVGSQNVLRRSLGSLSSPRFATESD